MNFYDNKDLYKILGIPKSADEEKIKSAYRKLARKYHPDVNPGNREAVVKFKEITYAYEILSNKQKKQQYDLVMGFSKYEREDNRANRAQAQKAYAENKKNESKSSDSKQDVFGKILKEFFTTDKKPKSSNRQTEEKIKDAFKNKSTSSQAEKGSDIYTDLTITISEAHNGTNRIVNILHTEKCRNCEGRKFINGSKCPLCSGTGETSIHKKINVKIPPNVKEHSKIRIANEGNKGYNGGKNGDLFLNIHIENHSLFKFDGLNISCKIPITVYEAVLGSSINVPTLDGIVSMKIPQNTISGQKFKLTGEGIVDSRTSKRGDMIVEVYIQLPEKHSQREIELYEELKKCSSFNPREKILNEI